MRKISEVLKYILDDYKEMRELNFQSYQVIKLFEDFLLYSKQLDKMYKIEADFVISYFNEFYDPDNFYDDDEEDEIE